MPYLLERKLSFTAVEHSQKTNNTSPSALSNDRNPARISPKAVDVLGCPLGGCKTVMHPKIGNQVLAREICPSRDTKTVVVGNKDELRIRVHDVEKAGRRHIHLLAPKGIGAADKPMKHWYLVIKFDVVRDPDIEEQAVLAAPCCAVVWREGCYSRHRRDAMGTLLVGHLAILDAGNLGEFCVGEPESEVTCGRFGKADVLVDRDVAPGCRCVSGCRDVFGVPEVDEAG